MARFCSALGVMALVVMLPAATVYGATSPAAKCAIAKSKAAAKKLGSKAKCYQKAVAKSMPVDGACLMAAETKFNAAITKAEAGACAIPGDGPTLEALVNRQVADMDSFTPAALPVCCQDAGGACWYGATAGDCAPTGTAGAAGTVCDGATGTCVAAPGAPGHCCSSSAGLTSTPPFNCGVGPELTDVTVCTGVGGNFDPNGLCPPAAASPASSGGPTCVHF